MIIESLSSLCFPETFNVSVIPFKIYPLPEEISIVEESPHVKVPFSNFKLSLPVILTSLVVASIPVISPSLSIALAFIIVYFFVIELIVSSTS